MNANDLMDALSGLDPKYIDEAAFELHGRPAQKKKATAARIRRSLTIALPIAAAALLTVMVAIPAVMRMSKSETSYAPAPSSDSPAAYAPAEEAAQEAAEEAPYYDDELIGMPQESATETETAGGEAMTEKADEAAESAAPVWTFKEAVFENGILTLATEGSPPADPGVLPYTIAVTDAGGTETVVAEGTLGEILTDADPLTLNLTVLALPADTYVLTVDGERITFTVPE